MILEDSFLIASFLSFLFVTRLEDALFKIAFVGEIVSERDREREEGVYECVCLCVNVFSV